MNIKEIRLLDLECAKEELIKMSGPENLLFREITAIDNAINYIKLTKTNK